MMHPFFKKIKSKNLRELLNSVDCALFVGDFKYDDDERDIFKKTLERWNREIKRIEEEQSMRSQQEIEDAQKMSRKDIEKTIGIRIVNGQGYDAIRRTLNWVLGNQNKIESISEKYSKKR